MKTSKLSELREDLNVMKSWMESLDSSIKSLQDTLSTVETEFKSDVNTIKETISSLGVQKYRDYLELKKK